MHGEFWKNDRKSYSKSNLEVKYRSWAFWKHVTGHGHFGNVSPISFSEELNGGVLCRSLFLINSSHKARNVLKKRLRLRCFPVNFATFSRKPSSKNPIKRQSLVFFDTLFL